MPELKLISFNLCPFVQRSIIALEEKGAPYAIEYIDLKNKPQWFLELSPLGKVPILVVEGTVLFESAVIAEYIDEITGEPHLLPRDPLERAKNRAWVEVASELFRKFYKLYSAPDQPSAEKATRAVRSVLSRFEEVITRGPFFNGCDFSLVDAAAAPALQRMSWCNELVPSLRLFDELPRVDAWRQLLLQRASVQRSTVPNIRELFVDYLKNLGDEAKGKPGSWIGSQA